MIKIAIISGTDRPNSNALKISEYVGEKYQRHGADVDVVSLADYPIEDVAGGNYGKNSPSVTRFNDRFISSDGIVFVVPEYNGSFPGILKLFIDHLPFPKALSKVPVCYIGESDGKFGALRALEQLQDVCGYRYAFNFPERVFIHKVSKTFDENEGHSDDFTTKLLNSQIKNFILFVEALTNAQLTKKKVPES